MKEMEEVIQSQQAEHQKELEQLQWSSSETDVATRRSDDLQQQLRKEQSDAAALRSQLQALDEDCQQLRESMKEMEEVIQSQQAEHQKELEQLQWSSSETDVAHESFI